jgi:hypothetical protein
MLSGVAVPPDPEESDELAFIDSLFMRAIGDT